MAEHKGPNHERPPEKAPPAHEERKPAAEPRSAAELENLHLPKTDLNKLHHIINDPDHGLDALVTKYASQESAFQAIAEATRDAIQAQGINGQYKMEIRIGDHLITVKGRVSNGIINIGTVYIPWNQ